MKEIIIGVQVLVSVLLMGAILMQAKGAGLGQAWGGGGEFYRSKRGLEKILYRATIVLAFVFFISSTVLSII
ncbi:MAG: preprotein translocase subunit SecG [bacterium]|nr:preprotein translocase subunit SecG [bacterium]